MAIKLLPDLETEQRIADALEEIANKVASKGAQGNLTAAQIKTAYESNANTNAFTDTLKGKLEGIEAGAEVNPTGSQIKTLYEGNDDTNAFTDAEKSKLSGIEAGAGVNEVNSVNGRNGEVVLTQDDVGEGDLYKRVTDVEKDTWDGKQDKLVAGNNITIDPDTNVISASDGIMEGSVGFDHLNDDMFDTIFDMIIPTWEVGNINSANGSETPTTSRVRTNFVEIRSGDFIFWRESDDIYGYIGNRYNTSSLTFLGTDNRIHDADREYLNSSYRVIEDSSVRFTSRLTSNDIITDVTPFEKSIVIYRPKSGGGRVSDTKDYLEYEDMNLVIPILDGKKYLGDGWFETYSDDSFYEHHNVYTGEYIRHGTTSVNDAVTTLLFKPLTIGETYTYAILEEEGVQKPTPSSNQGWRLGTNAVSSGNNYIYLNRDGFDHSKTGVFTGHEFQLHINATNVTYVNYRFRLQVYKGSLPRTYKPPQTVMSDILYNNIVGYENKYLSTHMMAFTEEQTDMMGAQLRNITSNDIYDLFDGLMTDYPRYVSRELVGYAGDSNGNDNLSLPIYAYTVSPYLGSSDSGLTDDSLKFMILAGIHGNEKASTFGLYRMLLQMFQGKDDYSSILSNATLKFIPIINRHGWDNHSRLNAEGKDINRSFITKNTVEASYVTDWMDSNKDVFMFIDFHNTANAGWFSYIATDSETMPKVYTSLIRRFAPIWLEKYSFDVWSQESNESRFVFCKPAITGTSNDYAHKSLLLDKSITLEMGNFDPNSTTAIYTKTVVETNIDLLANWLLNAIDLYK